MNESNEKAYVSIYCKIYTNNFSEEMVGREATGEEIYQFLLKDAQCCLPLRGDINLWYLGSNEKFGSIIYRNRNWKWSFGEASFDNVEQFVNAVYQDRRYVSHRRSSCSKNIKK